jgi:hypothetical protein
MRSHSIARPLATMIAVFVIACGGAPSAGGGNSAAPSASASASTPVATASIAPSAAPSAPAQSAYLDDRSSPEQLIRSYYNALSLRQYLRGYGYWERSSTLPTYDAFADGFADTTAVEVELGTVGGGNGAGQLYWSVPVAVLSTTTAGPKAFVECYTLHLGRPEIQAAPPFGGIAIQAAQISAVASAAIARSALATVCGSANATPLPWGGSGSGIDATRYLDDRTGGEAVVRSYYNAVNRKEFARAYSYFESGASGLAAFGPFSAGYADTKSVTLLTRPGTSEVGAGQLYYRVPTVITASNVDGTTTIFSGCYRLHLGSPDAQATPPFRPLSIQSAQISQASAGANANDLIGAACP